MCALARGPIMCACSDLPQPRRSWWSPCSGQSRRSSGEGRPMAGMGLIVIMLFFGLAGGVVGRMKGSSFVLWFLISGLVPFIGLITALCYRFDNQELRRECPGCGKVVKLHDALCTR